MPSTEQIEQIHEQLIPLGDEPRVAAERGEIIEPPARPQSGLDDDLSALLDDTDDVTAIAQQQAADDGGADTSALLTDFDSLLNDDDDEDGSSGTDAADDEPIIDLGDDDIPIPADYSFDPDIDAATDSGDSDLDDALSGLGDLGDLGDLDDLGTSGGESEDELGDLGDLGDLDELDSEAEGVGDGASSDTDAGEGLDDAFGGLGDLGDLDDMGAGDSDLDDALSGLGDLGDLGDLDDLGTADDESEDELGDLGDLGDLDELDSEAEGVGDGAASDTDSDEDLADAFGDLGDLGDLDDMGAGDSDLDDALSGLGDLGDLGDLDDLGTADDESEDELGDLGDLGDLDELDSEAEGVGDGAASDTDSDEDLADAFGDLGDLGDLDDMDAGDSDLDDALSGLGDLGDLGDFGGGETDPFADLAELENEAGGSGDSPEGSEDVGGDTSLDDGLGDLGDLGDLDEGAGGDDLGDFDIDSSDVNDTPVPSGDDLSSDAGDLGDLGDLDDLDDIAADDTFGSDFGTQIDADFGDIDADDLSEDPLSEGVGSAFELPSDDDIEDLASVDDFDSLDEEGFSLGDFGEEFDINEESIDEFAGLGDEGDADAGGGEDLGEVGAAPGEVAERELSDEEFSHVQQTLASLPLNVKIATEEAIGEGKGSAEQINDLLDQLIGGAPPVRIAQSVSKILSRKIEVPKGYQKRSGLAFEEEQRTFAYRFRHVILPIARVAVLVLAATAVIGFLGYQFVYRPIHAAILYQQGYQLALEDRYETANDTFDRAYELRPRDKWFVQYAELYVDRGQYQLAVEKYDQLVFGMDPEIRAFLREAVAENRLRDAYEVVRRGRRPAYPLIYSLINVDREAILDHGALQSEVLANYRRADELYRVILFGDETDYDALLARGDNFMLWGEEDPRYFEQARVAYAQLLAAHGESDPILMRFLRYFVRMDNQREVERVVSVFRNDPEAEVDPRIYADAAGYLMDRGQIADIRAMLIRAFQADSLTPEVHYELARYNRRVERELEERDALNNAKETFRLAEPLTPDRLTKQIDTDIRSGELWYRRGELLSAQRDFAAARERYDDALEAGFLAPHPELARVYAGLGDIDYYHSGDLAQALSHFNRAAADGYETEELNYKRGFIHYRNEDYEAAAELFYRIGSFNDLDGPDTVLYSRGNTQFQRGNFFAAEAFYREVLDRLQRRRDRIPTLLVEEDSTHRALIENLVRVNNNLGVTLYRSAVRANPRDPDVARALNHLRESTELQENYLRDAETGERAALTTLAFINMREILYPTEQYDPQIFAELPRDMERLEL
jgi:tetratricopeptide (TPR) repeat protein